MTRPELALLLAPLLFATQHPHAVAAPKPGAQITVRVYNYARVLTDILTRAQSQMQRIFNRFGVEVDWLDCPISPEHLSSNRTCSSRLGPNHLVLKLLPASMSKRYGLRGDIFGFASPTKDGLPGAHISIFFSRVLDLAYHGAVGSSFEDAQAIILGHMMAHEVGHLLLGPDSHGSRGVMKFPWDRRVLESMERGRLRFTTGEQKRILGELRSRSSRDR